VVLRRAADRARASILQAKEMLTMKRLFFLASTVTALGLASVAFAQSPEQAAGAGRYEVGVFPGGGTLFTQGTTTAQSSFKNYALGGSATVNLSPYVGLEGEIGAGLGLKQTIDFNQLAVADLKSPNTLAYNGDVAIYPRGKDHAIVPYVIGGLGGLTMFARSELAPLALSTNATFLTENVGGGVKWFASNNWGAGADYRFIVVNHKSTADPFFAGSANRYGHRISGRLLYTFGR
jgi:hypothetical protein